MVSFDTNGCWLLRRAKYSTMYVPHGEQGERPGDEPGGRRRRQALGAPGADVVEPSERGSGAHDPGDDGEDDEEPGRRVADGEVDRGEVRRELQPGADEEAVVDGVVDGPAADRRHDHVHAEVEHQQEPGHRLQTRVRHDRS